MNAKFLLIGVVVILAALSAASPATENPAGAYRRGPSQSRNPVVENPIGSPTMPPSSFRSGLVKSPNPIDTSGNQLITGNISGGRFFRGIVPYRATTAFEGTLGSSSLDSFTRDSAGAESYGSYTGNFSPYYSPSQSVTIMTPGSRGSMLSPLSTRIEGRAETPFAQPGTPKERPPEYNINTLYNRYRPMSTPVLQLERMLTDEIEKYPQGNVVPPENTSRQRLQQIEQFRYDLKQASDKVSELKQDLIIRNAPAQPAGEKKSAEGILPPQTQTTEGGQKDVYEQMQKEIDGLRKKFESVQKIIDASKPAGKTARDVNRPAKEAAVSRPGEPDTADITLKAKGVLGEHKTFASFNQDKFNQYMRAAEKYLKEGKYYRAADLYTLASVHKADDPLPYAGKSFSLFAAGEYMSSALFLSRAIEIFPQYAQFKVDIVSMVGDRDKLESRIAEIEQLLQKNDAPELKFLLGYVYYQINRFEPAKKNITAAYEKMPQSSAVITLKKVIDEAK